MAWLYWVGLIIEHLPDELLRCEQYKEIRNSIRIHLHFQNLTAQKQNVWSLKVDSRSKYILRALSGNGERWTRKHSSLDKKLHDGGSKVPKQTIWQKSMDILEEVLHLWHYLWSQFRRLCWWRGHSKVCSMGSWSRFQSDYGLEYCWKWSEVNQTVYQDWLQRA